MSWRVAGGVLAWHDQLQVAYPRAAPPATDVNAWGTVSDASHSSTSDHSPKDFPGWDSDVVTAGDAPHAPQLDLDMFLVTEAMRLSRDQRIKYVIFWERVFSSYASGAYPAWAWRPYTGSSDPHRDHAHLSVVGDARADGTQPWSIGVDMQTDERAALLAMADGAQFQSTNRPNALWGWEVDRQERERQLAAAVTKLGEQLTLLSQQVAGITGGEVDQATVVAALASPAGQDAIRQAAYEGAQRAEHE